MNNRATKIRERNNITQQMRLTRVVHILFENRKQREHYKMSFTSKYNNVYI